MPPKTSPPVAALEIGTSKIRVLVGEYRAGGQLFVTGLGQCLSRGVRKSEIVDFESALACVKDAVRQAEEMSRVGIHEVHLASSGGHLKSMVNRGVAPVRGPGQVVTLDDVEDVQNNARAVVLPEDRELLHSICQRFYLDDRPVANPEGMSAARLSLDMLILHGVSSRIRDVARVAREAHVEVEDSVFSGLAAGLAVLTAEQKDSGVLVIDLGAGTTSYVVYAGKAISHAAVLAVGGDHVTNDLMLGLKLPSAQAERIKLQNGAALVDLSRRSQMVSVQAESGFEAKQVRVTDIQTIISTRIEELFELVRRDLEKKGLRNHLGAGVILTGGGAHMPDIVRLAERVFSLPAAVGVPRGFGGLTSITEDPDFATGIGLLKYAQRSVEKFINRRGLGDRLRDMFGRG
ncbi:MAG: cell division protein FtsA [Kiritimatiellia bacterium]